MTATDAYVIMVILLLPLSIAVACGYVVDRWPDWRRRAMQRRADRQLRDFARTNPAATELQAAMLRIQTAVGAALVGPVSELADHLRAIAHAFVPGTVQNPSDPSPRPRVDRLIQDGVWQQDAWEHYRRMAEGDQQR